MLSLEIGELGEAGFDLSLTGFDEFELGELFPERTEGRTDPDDAPEPPAHPGAEPDDLWVLGRHRLLCGDSTVAIDVERVLGGVAPHLMVTDPPYGVSYDPAWRNRAAAQGILRDGFLRRPEQRTNPRLRVLHVRLPVTRHRLIDSDAGLQAADLLAYGDVQYAIAVERKI